MDIFIHNHSKSIHITPNGFSFFKKEGEKKAVKKEYPNVILGTLSQFAPDFLNYAPDETIDIIVNLAAPVLVPTPLFEEESLEKYLRMQFDISKQDHLFHDEISSYKSVYYLTDEVVNNLQRLNTPYQVIHQSTLLYRNLDVENDPFDHSIVLFVGNGSFDLILLKNKKIYLINKYNFSGNMDILYYILNIIKQFDLTLEKVNLRVIQNQPKEIVALLKKYIPNIESISY